MAVAAVHSLSKTERLAALRQMLAERFPAGEPARAAGVWSTGLPALDAPEGGLRRGALTEISSTPAGGALVLHALLESAVLNASFCALIDCGGAFDPDGCAEAALQRALWVRCGDAMTAVKAADLILRDGNFPLVLMDFQAAPRGEPGKVAANVWHRLQKLAEAGAAALAVFTREPRVESARVRIAVRNHWTLDAQRRGRRELLEELRVRIVPRRRPAVFQEA